MNHRLLIALLLPLLFAAEAAAASPATVKAAYDVHRDGLHIATVSETFEQRGNSYSILSESNPAGLLAMFVRTRIKVTSHGSVTAAGLRPDQLDYGRLDDASKNVSARFDWKTDQIYMTFDGRNETASLPKDTQDRVSLMYQFMFVPSEKLANLAFHMTNGKKIEAYRYQLAGNETLATPLGRLNTVHLVKQREAGDNAVEVWLAPEHHHLPVKVLIVENDGSRYEQLITRLETK
jgi:hypothetical protein